MKVYIMRGLPGSGKTQWQRQNTGSGTLVCSADFWFVDNETGEYVFEPEELPRAHDWCLRSFALELTNGSRKTQTIVVDNTNVRVWEIAPYYRLAEALGYDVEIVWVHCDPVVAAARNVHGVPEDKVMQMAQSFEPLPTWWRVRHVYAP